MLRVRQFEGMMTVQVRNFISLSKNGFHNVSYREWDNSSNARSKVICVHGLTRNAEDFNFLATQLKDDFDVVCPDIVGRGKSDWLNDPNLYNYPQYMSDTTCLFSRLNVSSKMKVDWVGTSMGGILGMLIAAQPNAPIQRLILNDIGPEVPSTALLRIKAYIEAYPTFNTLAEAKNYIRNGLASFGKLSEEQWDQITNTSVKKENHDFRMAYDPALITAYKKALDEHHTTENILWDIWKNIKCPILLLHGIESDVLTPEIISKMEALKPEMEIVAFENVGHAPALLDLQQTDIIKDWLMKK